jgi:AraC-like DNA-binding protein
VHVRRVFCRDLGLAPKEWPGQERMVRARQALAAGLPPAAVAMELGFATTAAFTREFRRIYGCRPRR